MTTKMAEQGALVHHPSRKAQKTLNKLWLGLAGDVVVKAAGAHMADCILSPGPGSLKNTGYVYVHAHNISRVEWRRDYDVAIPPEVFSTFFSLSPMSVYTL